MISEDNWEKHEEVAVNYADLKASIDDYYDENIAHQDQTDKNKNAIKDDSIINKKITEATKSFTKFSTKITNLQSSVNTLQAHALKQDEELAAWAKSSTNMAWNLGSRLLAVPKHDKGKGIATESDEDLSKRLVPASTIVRTDPDALIPYTINGEPEVIKVVQEEAEKIRLNPRKIASAKAGEKLKKAQDAKHQVLKREHIEKVRKAFELRKHKFESYMWTINNKLKPETITNIKIHPKTKPVVLTIYRGIDGRNFDVHRPFAFGAFGISELDELREIIPKKKNAVVHDLMNSLSRRKKRKHMEIDPKTKIPGLECNRALPEHVSFVNNMVIEESGHGIFFTDEFGDQAFQIWSDIDKVGMEALVSYLVAASIVKSPENARFSLKLKKLHAEQPDQEKLKSKKVKLEALGYEVN
ncbi:hypothetical protein Tco_0551775 [Tanacetum coccineum]